LYILFYRRLILAEAQHDQNPPDQMKPNPNLLPPNEDTWKQEQFLQSTPQFTKILVPYNASHMSNKALRYAIYLSKIANSDIFILSIIENYEDLKDVLPITIRVGRQEELSRSNKSEMQAGDLKIVLEGALRKAIEEKINLCKEAGLKARITYEIRNGNPSDEIIKVAEMTEFDLIIMGSHRITSTIKGIGSTTRKVMDTLRKPVLLIHE
jgi:nucleotide-binding universal stress UspA family protein